MPEKRVRGKGRKTEYINLKKKGESGDFEDLINPLDYLILEKLPEQGETAFGLYPQGESSQNLAKNAFKPLKPTDIAMRLRLMRELGLVIRVTMLSRTKEGWQRTMKGKEVYESWKESNKK